MRSWLSIMGTIPTSALALPQGTSWRRHQVAPVDDEGNFLIDEFEKLLTDRTKLVESRRCRMRSHHRAGQGCGEARHNRGIPGAGRRQPAAVSPRDRRQGYRLRLLRLHRSQAYGPTGIGVLYAKHEHLVAMRPTNGGGGG